MDYKMNYEGLIAHALKEVELGLRPKTKKEYNLNKSKYSYLEFHHIVPKSFGGTNDENNLIPFTAREHFIAHYLLCKINEDNKDRHYKMLNAFNRMAKCGTYNSKMYEYCRKELADARSKRFSRGSSPSARKVINLETLEVFNCVKDACEAYNVHNVSNCCRNEINESKGTFWQYYDDTKTDDYWKTLYKEKKAKSLINYEIRFHGKNNCNKKVIASTGEVFNSIKEANDWCGTNKVGACASGARKHAGRHPETGEQLSWKFC